MRIAVRTFDPMPGSRRAGARGRSHTAAIVAATALLVLRVPAFAAAGPNSDEPPSAEAVITQRARELIDTAIRYEEAQGMARSYAKAYALYCEAARLDHPDALLRMGWMYADGRGRPRDDAIANTLFRRAAGVVGQRDKLPECLRRPYQALTVADPEPPRIDFGPTPSVANPAEFRAAPATIDRRRLVQTVVAMAREFRIDPRLVFAVIRAESNFDHAARSHRNAQGLMQLIPETAQRFAVRDVLDPVDNLRGGMSYLRWLLSYFRGDVVLALAGYNAGEGAVDRHRGVPPYAETMAYVQRIRAQYPHDRHPFDERVAAPTEWLSESGGSPQRRPWVASTK
ncbi:MAG: lytic transglycosylase [Burkholderiales bacterium]|nr:MAG: lytic transglycosylase [Burkholderiales bacterium]